MHGGAATESEPHEAGAAADLVAGVATGPGRSWGLTDQPRAEFASAPGRMRTPGGEDALDDGGGCRRGTSVGTPRRAR
jgi:hypothetical protein